VAELDQRSDSCLGAQELAIVDVTEKFLSLRGGATSSLAQS
jgi:hypothetical protein